MDYCQRYDTFLMPAWFCYLFPFPWMRCSNAYPCLHGHATFSPFRACLGALLAFLSRTHLGVLLSPPTEPHEELKIDDGSGAKGLAAAEVTVMDSQV